MSFEIITTPRFEKSAKALKKRYVSLSADLLNLLNMLSENPFQGDELCPGIRKIRMAIKSKGKGKSAGARVITYNLFFSEQAGKIYLIDIHDKSDFSTVDVSKIKKIISGLEL